MTTALEMRLAEEFMWTPDDVRRAAEKFSIPTAEEIRRIAARHIRKASTGRGGLPGYVVDTMYEDYQRLQSLSKVGKLYGRTRQSMYVIFKVRGLELRDRNFQPKIVDRGIAYTPDKNGYYRSTTARKKSRYLHHVLWQRFNGPVPAGHQVSFKNADKNDIRIENLICLPIREVTLFHQRRHKAAKHPPRRNQYG